ncbi:MAG TPA: hypothetical protein VNW50_12705 [Streptosporangiaceae bacterium]|nr:hypothetical protein [Streptosporangiaceae bacterium]
MTTPVAITDRTSALSGQKLLQLLVHNGAAPHVIRGQIFEEHHANPRR